MAFPSQPPQFDPNNLKSSLQITKLLIMKFSPVSLWGPDIPLFGVYLRMKIKILRSLKSKQTVIWVSVWYFRPSIIRFNLWNETSFGSAILSRDN
jgi:hypothetical protein